MNIEELKAVFIENDRLEKENTRLSDALNKIYNWTMAYPVECFSEMKKEDWPKAEEVLKANGLSLGRISASNMRHVLNGVKRYCEEGLGCSVVKKY